MDVDPFNFTELKILKLIALSVFNFTEHVDWKCAN